MGRWIAIWVRDSFVSDDDIFFCCVCKLRRSLRNIALSLDFQLRIFFGTPSISRNVRIAVLMLFPFFFIYHTDILIYCFIEEYALRVFNYDLKQKM